MAGNRAEQNHFMRHRASTGAAEAQPYYLQNGDAQGIAT